ncbi:hypothetical protein CRPA25_00940 [Pseudomonas aeruginosa]
MTISLRDWQRRCIDTALEHFSSTPHFFCQATPGAGKTRMAAELTSRLLEQDRIDLVLCFAPSCQVVEGFRSTFAKVLGRRLDEPPRVSRRLHLLRNWSHYAKATQVFPRSP